ncbi:MAG: hypothetical protein RL616_538 [Verrucomicrobiota bacterium]
MTNPAVAIRALITYAICIPLAMIVGWMLCNPLDYGTLGFFGLVALLIISPVLIKWNYELMIFGLSSPIYCFFLQGNPPLSQVAVILCLGIAIVDRTMNSSKRFVSPALLTWPFLFTIAMVFATAELTGGIGLKALGGDVAGGKKYIALFLGCATFFAMTSRYIPKSQRNFYILLFFLPGTLQLVSDLFRFLPSPLNYINLLIPPSEAAASTGEFSFSTSRLGSFAGSAGAIANLMLAKYGLRGILRGDRPLRFGLFFLLLALTMMGGYRITLVSYLMMMTMLFFVEGLHRTRYLMVAIMVLVTTATLLVPTAKHLPTTFQRTLSFVPLLELDQEVRMDAEGSSKWREDMWRDIWPQVPQYLLLGKGYSMSRQDMMMTGDSVLANTWAAKMDGNYNSLAISGDYHNGPLSTLMPFGFWGAISYFWVALASLFVMYRNFKYGDAELKTVNTFLMIMCLQRFIGYFILFGAYSSDIGSFAYIVGFSVALNWGICAPKREAVVVPRIKPLPRPRLLPA